MSLRIALAALAAALTIAAPASAADPEEGEVSPAKPAMSWTGSIADPIGAYDTAAWFAGEMGDSCQAPACDTFALKVGAGGEELIVKVSGADAENVAFEVTDPDGNATYVDSEDTEFAAQRERSFPAAAGDWTIRISGTGEFDYKGTATLVVPGAAAPAPQPPAGQPAPPSSQPAPPSSQPQPQPASGGPAPAAAPAPTLTVGALARRARSARRLRKGRVVTVRVAATAALRNVTAVLVPASRRTQVLGAGRLRSLASRGSVRVKLRRSIKRGRYALVVAGLDSAGRRVAATRTVTVTR